MQNRLFTSEGKFIAISSAAVGGLLGCMLYMTYNCHDSENPVFTAMGTIVCGVLSALVIKQGREFSKLTQTIQAQNNERAREVAKEARKDGIRSDKTEVDTGGAALGIRSTL